MLRNGVACVEPTVNDVVEERTAVLDRVDEGEPADGVPDLGRICARWSDAARADMFRAWSAKCAPSAASWPALSASVATAGCWPATVARRTSSSACTSDQELHRHESRP